MSNEILEVIKDLEGMEKDIKKLDYIDESKNSSSLSFKLGLVKGTLKMVDSEDLLDSMLRASKSFYIRTLNIIDNTENHLDEIKCILINEDEINEENLDYLDNCYEILNSAKRIIDEKMDEIAKEEV